MSGRPVPSQLDQVLPQFSVQKAGSYHPFGRIRIALFGKGGLRVLAESKYSSVRLLLREGREVADPHPHLARPPCLRSSH